MKVTIAPVSPEQDARSLAAVHGYFERFLESKHPGTTWRAVDPAHSDLGVNAQIPPN